MTSRILPALTLLVAAAGAGTAQAATAPDTGDLALAEKRLRGCLVTGATTAPHATLNAALQSARAFCKPQIDRVADARIGAAANGLPDEAAQEVRTKVLRQLNNEIAYAVANFTGLTNLYAEH